MVSQRLQIALVLFLALGLAVSLPAQRGNRLSAEEREAQLSEVIEQLDLNAEQETSFRAIHNKYVKKAEALRAEAQGGQRGAMRDKMMALRDDRMADLAQVLSEEQMEKLQTIQRKEMEKRRRGRAGRRGPRQ